MKSHSLFLFINIGPRGRTPCNLCSPETHLLTMLFTLIVPLNAYLRISTRQLVDVASWCMWAAGVCGWLVDVASWCMWAAGGCGWLVDVASWCMWPAGVCGQLVVPLLGRTTSSDYVICSRDDNPSYNLHRPSLRNIRCPFFCHSVTLC